MLQQQAFSCLPFSSGGKKPIWEESNNSGVLPPRIFGTLVPGIKVRAGNVPSIPIGKPWKFFSLRNRQIALHLCVVKNESIPSRPRFPLPNPSPSLEWIWGSVYTSPTPCMSQINSSLLLDSYEK